MATKLNIDGVTYQIRKDPNGPAKANYDIRAGYPLNYITDYMSNSAVMNVAKSLRQLGYTVVDMRTA